MGDSEDEVRIAPLRRGHWPGVEAVWASGIATGHATFEARPPRWEDFDATRLPDHRLVALDTGNARVVGWAAVSPVSGRPVYRGVVEHSVYVDPAAQGRGVGTRLLAALVTSTEAGGIWTLQAGVFPENRASLALHYRAGFRLVGVRRRLGLMTYGPQVGRWRDVLMLERRSDLVGSDPGSP